MLENALAYVSALFNAQLANELVSAAKDKEDSSVSSLLLAALASFCLGVVLTLSFWRLSLAHSRDSDAAAPSGTIRVGKNQLNIVIDTSEGKMTGTRHNITPPEAVPTTVVGSRYPPAGSSSRRSSVDPDTIKAAKGSRNSRVAPIRSHRASMEPMFGNIALAEPSLAEMSGIPTQAEATPTASQC